MLRWYDVIYGRPFSQKAWRLHYQNLWFCPVPFQSFVWHSFEQYARLWHPPQSCSAFFWRQKAQWRNREVDFSAIFRSFAEKLRLKHKSNRIEIWYYSNDEMKMNYAMLTFSETVFPRLCCVMLQLCLGTIFQVCSN